jgi:3-phosphoshikimate 1-carboxyvinyltransferase
MPIASAQVKSAILLSGLYADRPTTVIEPQSSRDHTERLLLSFGAYLIRSGKKITVFPKPELKGQALTIPGDISSAAFFIVAALIVPNSSLTLYHVGINPTRRGVINVLLQMGANISLSNERLICGEPVCDIHVSSSKLSGITISGEIIPSLIDEIPILTVAACFASGTTIIKDAAELKFKESNRIEAISTELKKMGAAVTSTDDGLIIEGEQTLYGAKLETYNDHRIAMSLAIAALAAHSSSVILDDECIDISFPNFTNLLNTLK